MTDNASPFFIRPYRFDQDCPDDGAFPKLNRAHRVLLEEREQVLWQGRLDVAGYLVGMATSDRELCWTLPRPAQVTLTDRRLAYVCGDWDIGVTTGRGRNSAGHRFASTRTRVAIGQIRWQWPSRLQLLPPAAPDAAPDPRPGASLAAPPAAGLFDPSGFPGELAAESASQDPTTQGERLLFICDALRAARRPSLALAAVGSPPAVSIRELAVMARLAIARFRLANSHAMELSPPERDALRALLRPPYSRDLSDLARGAPLPGALLVEFLHRDDYYQWSPRSPRRRSRDGTAPTSAPTPWQPGAS